MPFATSPAELAAHLAAKLCHDLLSPVSAILSGLDLMAEGDEMRDDALALIGDSARKAGAVLEFARVAYGASAAADSFNPQTLHTLAAGVFAPLRPELDWRVRLGALDKPAARAVLNLAMLGAQALPMGGTVAVSAVHEGDWTLLQVECAGGRLRLRPEVVAGLAGEGPGDALPGQWIQAYYLHTLVVEAGGQVGVQQTDDTAVFLARTPSRP